MTRSGSSKAEKKRRLLAKRAWGNGSKSVVPGTPDGTGWVNASLVTITGAELPVIADTSAYPPVARTGTNLLGMQSSPEEIRDLILHPVWSVVWVDGQAVNYNPLNGRTYPFLRPGLAGKNGGRPGDQQQSNGKCHRAYTRTFAEVDLDA